MVPSYIIIHHSLTEDGKTVSWGAIRRYHVEDNGWNDIGYHYGIELIDDNYEILLGRLPDVAGAHCKEQGMNGKSLGICVVGNFDINFPAKQQMDKLVGLVKYLMRMYHIPVENVKRHSEYAPKSCPGFKFPWHDFKEMLL